MPLSEQILAAAASAVKNSVKKFVGLSAGELSGLIGDQLRFQRWKNAVRILDRAKVFCAKNKIPIKAIPLKFIVPFLDAASLEDKRYGSQKFKQLMKEKHIWIEGEEYLGPPRDPFDDDIPW